MLAWAFLTSGVELFFNNDRAMHIMTAVKESHVSRISLVTYQPQRIRLLNDINVFGLFLC